MELTEKPQSGHEYAETLLAAANKEQRGKLTVFLGAAAGVGKTCSMLQEAHARLREGTDIVLGLVLTHGRKETAALLEGLPRIPEQEIWQDAAGNGSGCYSQTPSAAGSR